MFLHIILFVCASFAFLRTLVDSLLVKWGKGLTYKTKSDRYFWTPPVPSMIMLCMGYLLFECLKISIALLMGDLEAGLWAAKRKKNSKEEIEMKNGESQSLVVNTEGKEDLENEDGNSGLLAYDEGSCPRESGDGKHIQVWTNMEPCGHEIRWLCLDRGKLYTKKRMVNNRLIRF